MASGGKGRGARPRAADEQLVGLTSYLRSSRPASFVLLASALQFFSDSVGGLQRQRQDALVNAGVLLAA